MDTPLAIISFIFGIISLIIAVTALVISINIYNATEEYRGIKRHRLKKSLKYYLRRSTHAKTNIYNHKKGAFRACFLSWWLLVFPCKLNAYIDKQQKKEIKRKIKNKWYSTRLAEFGLGGVIAFARNDKNDYDEDFLYNAFHSYCNNKDYKGLVSFIKSNFSIMAKTVENELLEKLMSMNMFWGIEEKQNELAGILLYLFWYRLNVLKEKSTPPNISFIIEKFDNRKFYEYFKNEYEKNIRQIHYANEGFGRSASIRNINDDRVICFLMYLKFDYFYSNTGAGSEMRLYIDEKLKGDKDTHMLELTEKEYKEQLELVGGTGEMTSFIVNYIKNIIS